MDRKKGTAATRAKNKYNAKTYDSLCIFVSKGKRDILKAASAVLGESLNGFVNAAIDERLARSGGDVVFSLDSENEGI